MTTDSPGQPPASEGERVARAGARWTREEEEQLVVEVRAGTDLAEIAGRHGRTRGGIKSRLVRMIPDGEDVPDSEQLAWITARLRGDPGFDWRVQLERVSDDSLAASEAARSVSRAGRVTGPDVVLAVWQQVNGRELSDQRRAEFLAHPALDDLTAFSPEILAETGRRLRDGHGELLLTAWAAECAEPGLTGLPPSGELGLSLARTAGVVRALVAALAGAVRSDSDRAVLQRRLGMQGGAPETLRQIGDDLGLSRERVRQRQERAIGQMRSAAVLPGHRSARDQARDRLTALVTGADGTPDGGLVHAVAALGLPQADRALAAQVIARATGARLHERDAGRGAGEAG
ncbi:MAG: sigma factor-like helix-turn-helix DNA-binding protein [Streptosporangiaceae bacterium]